jgi:hypothetical protein
MARKRWQLDPAIEALVRDRLEPNECILGWSEFHPGEVTVKLIDQELHRVCQERVRRFGRGAGCGRTLSFRQRDGQWVFVGVGGWIS